MECVVETPCGVRGGNRLVWGPSTSQLLALRLSNCSAQDDKLLFAIHLLRSG